MDKANERIREAFIEPLKFLYQIIVHIKKNVRNNLCTYKNYLH